MGSSARRPRIAPFRSTCRPSSVRQARSGRLFFAELGPQQGHRRATARRGHRQQPEIYPRFRIVGGIHKVTSVGGPGLRIASFRVSRAADLRRRRCQPFSHTGRRRHRDSRRTRCGVPSGDQTGAKSADGSNVKREPAPLAASIIQMSDVTFVAADAELRRRPRVEHRQRDPLLVGGHRGLRVVSRRLDEHGLSAVARSRHTSRVSRPRMPAEHQDAVRRDREVCLVIDVPRLQHFGGDRHRFPGKFEAPRVEGLRHQLSVKGGEQQVALGRVLAFDARGNRRFRFGLASAPTNRLWCSGLATVSQVEEVIAVRKKLWPQVASLAGTVDGRDRRWRSAGVRHARETALAAGREEDRSVCIPRATTPTRRIADDLRRSARKRWSS